MAKGLQRTFFHDDARKYAVEWYDSCFFMLQKFARSANFLFVKCALSYSATCGVATHGLTVLLDGVAYLKSSRSKFGWESRPFACLLCQSVRSSTCSLLLFSTPV
jgi:hypothetical protein